MPATVLYSTRWNENIILDECARILKGELVCSSVISQLLCQTERKSIQSSAKISGDLAEMLKIYIPNRTAALGLQYCHHFMLYDLSEHCWTWSCQSKSCLGYRPSIFSFLFILTYKCSWIIQIKIVWFTTRCSLVCGGKRFGQTCCLHFQIRNL